MSYHRIILIFWDKLEKANYFLENIIETASEDEDSRLVSWLLDTPQQDGGQWDMLVSIIENMESFQSQLCLKRFKVVSLLI